MVIVVFWTGPNMYIGCYRDDAERDMKLIIGRSFEIGNGRAYCASLKMKYFALQGIPVYVPMRLKM